MHVVSVASGLWSVSQSLRDWVAMQMPRRHHTWVFCSLKFEKHQFPCLAGNCIWLDRRWAMGLTADLSGWVIWGSWFEGIEFLAVETSSRRWHLDGKAFAEGYILGRPPHDSKTQGALRSEPKLTRDSSSLVCPCCSFHSSFYDNCSDTICIYENHINFTGASGIAYKSIFFTSVESRKQ